MTALPRGVMVRVVSDRTYLFGSFERNLKGTVGMVTDFRETSRGQMRYGVAINGVVVRSFNREDLVRVREVCEWIDDE